MNLLRIATIVGALLVPGAGLVGAAIQIDDLTTDEARYFGAASTLSGMMGASLTRVQDLTDAPRLQDLDWQNDYLGETAVWRAVYARAQEVDPPERLEEVHETSLEGFALFDQAAIQSRAAIEALDPDGLVAGALLVADGGAKLTEASELIAEID